MLLGSLSVQICYDLFQAIAAGNTAEVYQGKGSPTALSLCGLQLSSML